MGSSPWTLNLNPHKIIMKSAVLVLCLIGAALAAPIEMIDPDCIEEDLAFEEPMANINAEFALGVPDLVVAFGDNVEECEDDLDNDVGTTQTAEQAPTVSEEAECEDYPIEATDEPVVENYAPDFEVESTEAAPVFTTEQMIEFSVSVEACEEETVEPTPETA